jgi:hypothetical protein
MQWDPKAKKVEIVDKLETSPATDTDPLPAWYRGT